MTLAAFLEILLAVCSLTAAVVVGRSSVKKHLIADLQALVLVHEQTIKQMKKDGALKDERIRVLEETVNGYAELVRQGYLTGGSGPRSRNRSTSAKTP